MDSRATSDLYEPVPRFLFLRIVWIQERGASAAVPKGFRQIGDYNDANGIHRCLKRLFNMEEVESLRSEE